MKSFQLFRNMGFVILFCACNGKDHSPLRRTQKQIVSDSFSAQDITISPSLQYGIKMDSVRKEKKGSELSMIYPIFSKSEYPEVRSIIDSFLLKRLEDLDASVGDTASFGVNTLLLYKTDALVSLAFEYTDIAKGQMRHFFRYFTLNYDLTNKRRIGFTSYFNFKTNMDTAFMKRIIHEAIGWNDGDSYDKLLSTTKFAFNWDRTYFFFDMFEHMFVSTGMNGSVKTKYLEGHMNKDYLSE